MSYLLLFIWSFFAATVIPVGSEPFLIGMVRADEKVLLIVAIATLGNFLGACTLYWMGKRMGVLALKKWGKGPAGSRATNLLQRYGKPALALAWIPVLGDVLVGLAGASGVSFGAFSAWVITGKALRYGFVAWVAMQF